MGPKVLLVLWITAGITAHDAYTDKLEAGVKFELKVEIDKNFKNLKECEESKGYLTKQFLRGFLGVFTPPRVKGLRTNGGIESIRTECVEFPMVDTKLQ